MRTSIIICTSQRANVLHDTILNVLHQTVLPSEILVSLNNERGILPKTLRLPLVRVVQAPKGLTKQRNVGIDSIGMQSLYVLFLDDDMELMPNYIESMEQIFDEKPEIVLASSATIANGAGKQPLTRAYAELAVGSYQPTDKVEYSGGAYGCNMFVRRSILTSIRFDERLPLYSMMEDHDFSVQCLRHGKACWNFKTGIVHLASSSGRINGQQTGYSQLANSFYLWRKGSLSTNFCFVNCWTRFLLGNLIRIFLPKYVDRTEMLQRFQGNLLALGDALRFRLSPEGILRFR